ncbi:hypothetical protein NP493_1143g01020 [Ridgeia piscesae]|uniref:Uncharacterized protein n=1 Tax=Ridgeia piscesae TaxID=27915 RepID=A0AAD9NJN4_RIDPI|nr:hypothetical protein NP493_1143g01020 [Ridgeia piscesae]
MFNILLSIFVCATASLFFTLVMSAHVSAPYVIAGIMSCRFASSKNVAVLGKCCPSGRDSSLNLITLIFVSGAISLSQVDVAFNVLDLSVGDIYWCVGFSHHLYLRLVQLQTLIVTFIS